VKQDPIIVTVNDRSLTRSQAERLAREAMLHQGLPPQMADQYIAQAGEQLEKQAIEQFISQTLMRTEAERRQEPVTDADIDTAISHLKESLPPGMPLEQILAAQGVTVNDLRRDVIANERLRKLFEAETSGTSPITDAQVSAFYKENTEQFTTEESVEARHVLIGCEADAAPDKRAAAKAKAEEARKQIVAGEDFAEVAKAKSTCPSRQDGGALGAMQRGRVVPEFEKAMFTQPIGEIGPVVETQFGYHVIQVTGKKPGGTATQADVAEQIREHLTSQAREECFGRFLQTLRAKAQITYGDPTGGIIIP
jgi:peptidyl-prolyl cis-trans isomerase C